jgi:hypothetical protein
MLIKCYGGPCDGQVIEIPQENEDCRLPSSIPMPIKVDDEFRFVDYVLTVEYDNGWTIIKYKHI